MLVDKRVLTKDHAWHDAASRPARPARPSHPSRPSRPWPGLAEATCADLDVALGDGVLNGCAEYLPSALNYP